MAELYRWVDETGTTVYSQVPPPGAIPATKIRPDRAPGPPPAQPTTDPRRAPPEPAVDAREEQTRQREAAAKQAAEQATRRANCDAARANLRTLREHGGARIRTPDGEARFLSRDELERMQGEAAQQIEDNCH